LSNSAVCLLKIINQSSLGNNALPHISTPHYHKKMLTLRNGFSRGTLIARDCPIHGSVCELRRRKRLFPSASHLQMRQSAVQKFASCLELFARSIEPRRAKKCFYNYSAEKRLTKQNRPKTKMIIVCVRRMQIVISLVRQGGGEAAAFCCSPCGRPAAHNVRRESFSTAVTCTARPATCRAKSQSHR
jgi:hypothetical protein